MNGPCRQHGKTTGSSLWEVFGAPIFQIIIIVVATVTCNVPACIVTTQVSMYVMSMEMLYM